MAKIKQKNNKRLYIRLVSIVMVIIALLIFVIVTWYKGDNYTINYINKIEYNYTNNSQIEITKHSEDNYVEINNKTGRNLKILQLTDLHICSGILTRGLDKKLVNAVVKCVDTVDPDLIFVTGDALSAIYVTAGTKNSYNQLNAFIDLFEKLGRPYTFCFGNHDDAGLAKKDYISKRLTDAPHSFFLEGEKDITGKGNYYIKILTDGVLTSSIILMDSGDRASDGNYAGVSKDQVEWYAKTIQSLQNEKSDIKNIVFMHIPLPEYNTFYNNMKNGDSNYKLVLGEKNERVCNGKQNGMYDKMKELNSTKWVFCGHDHTNNYSIMEISSGITLSYGMSMDYSTYPLLRFQTKSRGGRVIEIDNIGMVNTYLVKQDNNYKVVD